MARIPYPDPGALSPEVKATLEKLPDLNIFRMMAHAGNCIENFVRLGNSILMFSKLDPILREIAIVRVGVLSGASYEVYQHERISRQLGMSEEKIAAIHEGPAAAAFNDLERAVMRYTDDVVRNVKASDSTWRPLTDALSYEELQELTLTIGYYMMVSRFLENFEVDIEEEGRNANVNLKRQ